MAGVIREGNKAALVVDGASLAMIMNRYSEEFRDLCLKCAAVLCCRMTPIQKAKVCCNHRHISYYMPMAVMKCSNSKSGESIAPIISPRFWI